eukprot:COSAG03_NODE_1139_length_4740_cov_2.288084_2_plen_86_part_00
MECSAISREDVLLADCRQMLAFSSSSSTVAQPIERSTARIHCLNRLSRSAAPTEGVKDRSAAVTLANLGSSVPVVVWAFVRNIQQ